MNVVTKSLLGLVVFGGALGLTGCKGGDDAALGEPVRIGLSLSDSRVASQGFNFQSLLFSKAYALNVGDVNFCFKRLRFKLPEGVLVNDPASSTDDSSNSGDSSSSENHMEDNIDFPLGLVSVDPAGTDLGELTVPKGEYVRIEFDLENDCDGGNSVELSNVHGVYSSQERITIKYDGLFIVEEGAQIDLPLEDIVDMLDNFSTASADQADVSRDLKDSLEALSIRVSNY